MRIHLFITLLFGFFTGLDVQARAIYVLGDSHAGEFDGVPNAAIFKLNGATMNRVGRIPLDIHNLYEFRAAFPDMHIPLTDNDAIVYAFGQIDVGYHIVKQRENEHRDLDEIIKTLALKYISGIYLNLLPYPNAVKIIYSITPPTNNAWSNEQPCWGTLEERVQITKKLNALLKSLCQLFNFEFLDVYDDYATSSGILNPALSDGGVHIAYTGTVHKKLNEILGKHWLGH